MILHQTFGSARAERPTEHMPRRMMRLLLTSLLTSALTLPSLAARGIESLQGKSSPAIFRDNQAAADSAVGFRALDRMEYRSADAQDRHSHRAERASFSHFQAPQARNHMTIS
jgi:hypothetical protein